MNTLTERATMPRPPQQPKGYDNEFVKRIKELLGNREQQWLAEKTGVSPSAINRILSGTTTPKGSTVAAIAKTLDVTVDYLYTGRTLKSVDGRVVFLMQELTEVLPYLTRAQEEAILEMLAGIVDTAKSMKR